MRRRITARVFALKNERDIRKLLGGIVIEVDDSKRDRLSFSVPKHARDEVKRKLRNVTNVTSFDSMDPEVMWVNLNVNPMTMVGSKVGMDERIGMAKACLRQAKALLEEEGRTAAGIMEEAKALKMKGVAEAFFDDVKKFKGSLNRFIDAVTGEIRNPRALAEFPEIRDAIQLSQMMKKGVLKATFMSDAELMDRLSKVVCRDAGTC